MKTYIIAEIGINHNGELSNCYKMIDASVEAGCSAVKFQLFNAKSLYPKSAGTLDWKNNNITYNYDIYEAVKKFEMPIEWIDSLRVYCATMGIDFISSVFDIEGMKMLVGNGIDRVKLSSYTITNIPLIKEVASHHIPIYMSTGGATLGEIEDAVRMVQNFHNDLTLLHCSIQYPTALKDCNLGVLDTFRYAFPELKYGYSDHTLEISEAPVQAVLLGAQIIEKHITLNKNMEGPDHFFALEPHELNKMVLDIREAEKNYSQRDIDTLIYGSSMKKCYENEKYLRDFAFMRLFINRDISAGERITINDISILRPGKKQAGLEPKYLALFENYTIIAKADLKYEDPLLWDSIL